MLQWWLALKTYIPWLEDGQLLSLWVRIDGDSGELYTVLILYLFKMKKIIFIYTYLCTINIYFLYNLGHTCSDSLYCQLVYIHGFLVRKYQVLKEVFVKYLDFHCENQKGMEPNWTKHMC